VAELALSLRDRQQRPIEGGGSVKQSSGVVQAVRISESLRDVERRTIQETWESTGGNLSAAARALGLPRTTLRDRLKKYGLR
jgi:DNA-binding NtrC family response regulator